ncbi:MAG: MFS transporter [Coxiella sp. (in: Bacteria)]|nr:MAG: MFS transporter [Coxiella sp. (in: g-proteobacteria)]
MNTASYSASLKEQDESTVNKYHWRIVFTAGTGFFTDAYDLFIIGVVTAILTPLWHLTKFELSWLNGASLIAAAVGAVFFGTLSDKLGRKKLYGLEAAILVVGAIWSACTTSFTGLLMARILVGLGIGGDYPSSATVVSESANRKNRGFLVLLVFAMQALGLIVGPLLASLLLSLHIPHDYVWRILLGLGALPAASVIYLRRTIKESKRFLMTKEAPLEVGRVVHDLVDGHDDLTPPTLAKGFKKQSLLSSKWLKCMIGTGGAWFLMDVALYGNGVSNNLILSTLSPHANILQHTLVSVLIFLVFAVPGYFLSARYIDRIGRKPIQYMGFIVMTIAYLLIAIPGVSKIVPLFIIIYGMSYLFINFGPNATTFLIPSEIYPTSIRAKAHGISAAIGKCGAFIGAFTLPLLLASKGMSYVMTMMAVMSFLGIFATMFIPEMKNVSLDEVEEGITA